MIETRLKGMGLEAILLIQSLFSTNIHMICQDYQELGSTYQSHRQVTEAGVATDEGVDFSPDAKAADEKRR